MRAGDEYSELSELGVGSGSGGVGGAPVGPSGIPSTSDRLYGTTKSGPSSTTGSWTRSRSRGGVATDLDDPLVGGGGGSPRGHARSRSGLYYSPPGTSYTIVERPSSALHHHREYSGGAGSAGYGGNSIASPRGTYLGSNPNFHSQQPSHRPSSSAHHHSAYHSHLHHASNNKKRPISPEQVLRLFNNQSGPGGGKHPGTVTTTGVDRPRRSPASSPPSTTHNYHHHRPAPPPLTVHELSTRTVTMMREPPEGTHGFGICVKGGKDAGGIGVYISRVEEGSVAERAGLRPGDTILEVNGTPFTAVSHEDALKMLKSCKKLSMTVRSPTLPGGGVVVPGLIMGGGGGSLSGGMGSGTYGPVRQTCSWMDRQGRPVSPPLEYSRPPGIAATQRTSYGYGSGRSGSKDRSVRRVDLCIEPGQSLGLMIRGGVEYNLGIFVTGVDKDSVADRAGLMVGDQILDVNGQSFMEVTHDEAVSQLKYHKRMSLLVRDVGKVPHSCTAYDREWDLCSPGSRAAQTTRKWAAALQMVEEKARCILAKHEFTTLCYYTDEYSARHMTIDAFVQVMTELLNTPDKYTLMIELREIVAVEDRIKFDELVYRTRDSGDTLPRGRLDPRDNDYRHSRRKGDLNHSNLMMSSAYQELQDFGAGIGVGGVGGFAGFNASSYNEDEYRSPSEDSGLGLSVSDRLQRTRCPGGKTINTSGVEYHRNQDYCDENGGRRHSSPGESRTGSTTALHQPDYPDSSGYLVGLRSSLGGWTQKVKSWYWGRPLELAHKLSRSFDMKDEQSLLDGDGAAGGGPGGLRRHQSMQRLAGHGGGGLIGGVGGVGGGLGPGSLGVGPGVDSGVPMAPGPPRVVTDAEGNLRVTVRKTKPILGIAIEGGANTKHPLPRIININENGAAYCAGGLEVGQLILQVDGTPVDGLQHQDVARLIAESFARRDRDDIEFLVVEAKKSNMEPKPTALIFLEA